MKKFGLIPWLVLGIVSGILVGLYFPGWVGNILFTFTQIFGQFLSYIVPLIILGFIIPGIADLGAKAGKLLGATAGIAYISTLVSGILAFFISRLILPAIVSQGALVEEEALGLTPYISLDIPPMMGVMTALVTAFIFGLGINFLRHEKAQTILFQAIQEFRQVIVLIISKVIIPLLPLYIAGIFADMAATGEAFATLRVFSQVFVLIIAMHLGYIMLHFTIAGVRKGINPLRAVRTMGAAYATALGTMSSAATIPVTLQCTKNNGVSREIADFTVPLCATIHLAGSTITLVACSVAVLIMNGGNPAFLEFLPFIILLGITMVAAPGVPGGAVMAALGLLTTILGFSPAQQGLMIALYMAQDGFGTACNVTCDGAISLVIDSFAGTKETKNS